MAIKRRKINLKEIVKDKQKGFFKSRGYAPIKRTYIDKHGEQITEILEVEIQSAFDHPALKQFAEENPAPKAPMKRVLLNTVSGKTATEEGISAKEAKGNPLYQWAEVFDYTEEKYQEEKKAWDEKQNMLLMMVVFDLFEDFGIDKTDEFKTELESWGLTPRQMQNLLEGIKELDFLSEDEKANGQG